MTLASRATSAASPAVQCDVSRARSRSSARKVASWTRSVGAGGRFDDRGGGGRVSAQDDLAAGASRPQDVVRRDDSAVGESDGLAALEQAPFGAVGHPETRRLVHVEPARTRGLDELVADGAHSVLHTDRLERVAVALETRPRVELDVRDGIGEPSEDPPERPEKLAETTRPVDRERDLAPAQRKRLEHSRKAEVVVGVIVGQEDLLELQETDVAAQELPLRALPAVEEQPLAAAPH